MQPALLEIHNQNAAEKWKAFSLAWDSFSLATKLNKKSQAVQVATLLTVTGEEACACLFYIYELGRRELPG